MPEFAGLVQKSKDIDRAAIVVDVREGQTFDRLPDDHQERKAGAAHARRLSRCAGRRCWCGAIPKRAGRIPCGALRPSRARLWKSGRCSIPIRNVADTLIDTSRFNVHELRAEIQKRFGRGRSEPDGMLVSCLSFGFKNGVPLDADMVFDVRFLPNPHFVPEFHDKTGLDPKVAAYVSGFSQTGEFLTKVTDLMLFLMPHYVKEGKSYLTVAFGCTGGQHRSVMMAEEMTKRLTKAGYHVKAIHRDMPALSHRAAAGS